MNIIYSFFGFIDWVVYNIISAMFRVIVDLSTAEIFYDENDIISKIYVVVGVFILFKLVISAIQFMVNPDLFDDKEKGLTGILKNTVISIAFIVISPAIFNFATVMEKPIIETIPRIILGNDKYSNAESRDNETKDIGESVSMEVLKAFVSPKDANNTAAMNDIKNLDSFRENISKGCGLFNAKSCVYDYMLIISTICGGFIVYILLSMVLDVAVRTVKLSIIRMLAPIPISTYVYNKDRFNKFVKVAVQVYVDLFVRMAIVYFVIFAVKAILASEIWRSATSDNWIRDAIVHVALVVGLLMFAKSAPKFLSDLLGIPDVGSGDMKDMFKPAWQRVGGLAAPASAIGAYRNAREYGESKGKALRRAFTAGSHASISRLKDIASGKGLDESYKTSRESAMGRTNRNLEYANRFPNRKERRQQIRQERWDKYTGVTTGGKKASAQIEAANRALKARSNAWSRAQSKVVENASAYNGGTHFDSHGNRLTYADMYALFEKDAPEMYDGQKRELASLYQGMKDKASTDFLRKSFAGVATGSGDGQSRNVFAEDVFSIARSGADKDTVGKLLFKDITVSSGNVVHIDAIDAAERINKMNQLRDANVPLTDPRWNGLQFSADEAEALAMFARDLNKTAGTVRLEATKTQTTVPKEN